MSIPVFVALEPVNGEARMLEHDALRVTDYERSAGETPTNQAFVPEDLRRFGYGPESSASENRTALLAALSVAGGSDYGYGMPQFLISFPQGTAEIASGGDIIIPVNVRLVSECGSQITLNGTDRLVFRNPAPHGGAHSQPDYWPYTFNEMRRISVSGGGGVLLNNTAGFRAMDCEFLSMVELRNTHSMWTEQSSFNRCGFIASSGAAIRFNGTLAQSNPGAADGSFAYTEFRECRASTTGTANLLEVIDGGTFYGGKAHFKCNHTSSGALFATDDSDTDSNIREVHFDVRVESGGGTSELFSLSGGTFWNNKGFISLPSYDFSSSETGVSFRQNYLVISGAECANPWDASTILFLGDQFASIAIDSVVRRIPVTMRTADIYRAGTMTAAAIASPVPAASVVGPLPFSASRILRVEITARVAPSGNTDGQWYFDILKAMDDINYGGITSIYLEDGENRATLNLDVSLQASPFDGTWLQGVLASKPTDGSPSGRNNGTGPSDVWARIYYLP